MRKSTKLLTAAAAAATVMAYVAATQAGQEPVVAYVGEDKPFCDQVANTVPCRDPAAFYISPKIEQFTHEETDFVPGWCGPGCPGESFVPPGGPAPIRSAEVCDEERWRDPFTGEDIFRGETNFTLRHISAGAYEWSIVLPKTVVGNLNITLQCGLLKPDAQVLFPPPPEPPLDPERNVINFCAGETGERVEGVCERKEDRLTRSGIRSAVLPTLTAFAEDVEGLDAPFRLTAYRNPSQYFRTRNAAGELRNSRSLQILDGSAGARFALKACMTKSIFVRKPLEGQVNAAGETEFDLSAGDRITVRASFPRGHTMDVYCHARSVSIQTIGDPITLIDDQDPDVPF